MHDNQLKYKKKPHGISIDLLFSLKYVSEFFMSRFFSLFFLVFLFVFFLFNLICFFNQIFRCLNLSVASIFRTYLILTLV